jgi:hypothetical protein
MKKGDMLKALLPMDSHLVANGQMATAIPLNGIPTTTTAKVSDMISLFRPTKVPTLSLGVDKY